MATTRQQGHRPDHELGQYADLERLERVPRKHADELLDDDTIDEALDELSLLPEARDAVELHRQLVTACRTEGIDAAYVRLLTRDTS
jgi:hypothetical protein